MKLYHVCVDMASGIQSSLNPHGNYINDEIHEWLISRYGPYPEDGPIINEDSSRLYTASHFEKSDALWDAYYSSLDSVCFVFKDPDHATLFKLTWGGS